MQIDWDVPIEMDDGLALRADVYRPVHDDRYPVILSYGPYGKGLRRSSPASRARSRSRSGRPASSSLPGTGSP
jgi:predicted acyl esterase